MTVQQGVSLTKDVCMPGGKRLALSIGMYGGGARKIKRDWMWAGKHVLLGWVHLGGLKPGGYLGGLNACCHPELSFFPAKERTVYALDGAAESNGYTGAEVDPRRPRR